MDKVLDTIAWLGRHCLMLLIGAVVLWCIGVEIVVGYDCVTTAYRTHDMAGLGIAFLITIGYAVVMGLLAWFLFWCFHRNGSI